MVIISNLQSLSQYSYRHTRINAVKLSLKLHYYYYWMRRHRAKKKKKMTPGYKYTKLKLSIMILSLIRVHGAYASQPNTCVMVTQVWIKVLHKLTVEAELETLSGWLNQLALMVADLKCFKVSTCDSKVALTDSSFKPKNKSLDNSLFNKDAQCVNH